MFGRSSKMPAKTPDQVRSMRRAGLVVGETLAELVDAAREGLTTGELDTVAEAAIRGRGATPSFLGYQGFPGSICVSVNDEIVHGIPGDRVLQEGDLVSIDCGAIVDGWHGDAAVTVVVGGDAAARPEDLDLSAATRRSMWEGIRALVPGSRLYDVGGAVEDSIAASARDLGRTLSIVDGYTGHGIGTEMHQDPHVFNERVREKGPTVTVGTTVAIEPMVTLGTHESHELDDEWTVVTDDGSRACHWEHTVAVTDGGLWVLTALDGGEADLGDRYAPLDLGTSRGPR
ncbi:type I methionyl aminopeptidase [Luteipulveratus halotolerans]|uniref:Methionine aminopeptidase n=1 Tax=Luteipulveratus halotolerans TaxID=1631356 RepID=A0A0L6CMZ3_9MICO|nr:type I methionyl aminopeptidase [Luteipulveratus halotolerans]KNX39166.1 methionine aminopeptidase [Luteipulveratus halotolerans]